MTAQTQHTQSDPHGYYAVLGVGPLADTTEIKAAYRYKAKLVHPDRNHDPDARVDFLAVSRAYEILRNPKSRAEYDSSAQRPVPASLIDPTDPTPKPLACSRCGQVTAQPRYIVFYQVRSFLWKSRRTPIHGIFCRHCADRTAILASTTTWILGWWSPRGVVNSVAALVKNLQGGEKPANDNLWVLLHQARAFLTSGSKDIAHALTEQAQDFAKNDGERERIADIAKAARGGPTRQLINRWHPWNYATVVQALPMAAAFAALLVFGAIPLVRRGADSAQASIAVHPAQAGETRHVAVEMLKVRQGPADSEPVVALLDRFMTVQVVEMAPGDWARILTPSGMTGYVPSRYLFGGSGDTLRTRWCKEQKGDPPDNGDILLRRAGGQHRLTVRNATGDDVVVRLKTANGRTLIAFFVGENEETVIDGIPDGTFRAVFASGRTYSRACGVFLDDMRTFIVPATATLNAQDKNRKDLTLVLPAAGEGPNRSYPLPPEGFLDGSGS
jgi:hypothetical protein